MELERSGHRMQHSASAPSGQFGQTGATLALMDPSWASRFEEPMDLEPGPGSFDLIPSVGRQVESLKENSCEVTLGARHAAWGKMLISKHQLQELRGRDTPGPAQYAPQLSRSQSGVRFNKAKKFDKSTQPQRGRDAPGPAAYDIRTKYPHSKTNTRFTKSERFDADPEEDQIGPGQYQLEGSLKLDTGRSFGEGFSAYKKVGFPGSSKLLLGTLSPGPGMYKQWEPSGARVAFAKAKRPDPSDQRKVPGAGTYNPKPFQDKKQRPCYSFGKPRPKARFDWKTLRIHGDTMFGLF